MSDTAVPLPDYSDGYRKGFEAAHAEMREEELAACFQMSVSVLETLVMQTQAINSQLGQIPACETDKCRTLAKQLKDELGTAKAKHQEIAKDHRAKQKRLQESR